MAFTVKTYVVSYHKNRLERTILMMGHKICFNTHTLYAMLPSNHNRDDAIDLLP